MLILFPTRICSLRSPRSLFYLSQINLIVQPRVVFEIKYAHHRRVYNKFRENYKENFVFIFPCNFRRFCGILKGLASAEEGPKPARKAPRRGGATPALLPIAHYLVRTSLTVVADVRIGATDVQVPSGGGIPRSRPEEARPARSVVEGARTCVHTVWGAVTSVI